MKLLKKKKKTQNRRDGTTMSLDITETGKSV